MKKVFGNKILSSLLILGMLLAFVVSLPWGGTTTVDAINRHKPTKQQQSTVEFESVIHKGGFFGLTQESPTKYLIFSNRAEIDKHIADMVVQIRKDNATVPEGYFEGLEKQIQDTFQPYNNEFFKNKKLVVILLDSGAGNTKYEFKDATIQDNRLTVNVQKNMGLIQTMDYINWVMTLSVENAPSFDTVTLNLVTNTPTPPPLQIPKRQ